MIDYLKVVVAQSPAELCGQQERLNWIEQQLKSIQGDKVDLFILPELFLSGYNIGSKLLTEGINNKSTAFEKIGLLARNFKIAIHFSYPEKESESLYNASSCISADGKTLSTYRKLSLPPGLERDFFKVGSNYHVFEIGTFKISTLICYDAEFPENFRPLAAVDLVVVPTALSAQWGIVAQKLIPTRAFENGLFICYANHTGIEEGMEYYGGSCIIAPNGCEQARANKGEQLISAVLDKKKVQEARERLPYHLDRLLLPTT